MIKDFWSNSYCRGWVYGKVFGLALLAVWLLK